jgi:hypothetical protein
MDIEKDGYSAIDDDDDAPTTDVCSDAIRTVKAVYATTMVFLVVDLHFYFVVYFQQHGCRTQLCKQDYKAAMFEIFASVVFMLYGIYYLLVVWRKYRTLAQLLGYALYAVNVTGITYLLVINIPDSFLLSYIEIVWVVLLNVPLIA